MPTNLNIGDHPITVSDSFQPVKLDIVDVDVRREPSGSLATLYWLSDGRRYLRSELFTSMPQARAHCEACFLALLARFDS
jgi:hypothetical protein